MSSPTQSISLVPDSYVSKQHDGSTTFPAISGTPSHPSSTKSHSGKNGNSSLRKTLTKGKKSSKTSSQSARNVRPKEGARRDAAGPRTHRVRKKPVVTKAMTPAQAMQRYMDKLTNFEQSEILEYSRIYFVGPNADKIKGIPHTSNNNGYDDSRGDYQVVPGDHMEYRYEVKSVLGRGSFGQVLLATDHKRNTDLALKIIRNKKRFHRQAQVEVRILEHLMARDREHASGVVRVFGYFYFRNHLCITFELLSLNLYEFIKKNRFRGFPLSLIRSFATQMLHSLNFLKGEGIIHCDLKPENVLLKSRNRTGIRMIDFGSSCFHNETIYTYIQSRFYRAPEVIMGLKYSHPIDMWSFGCILAELYSGYPIFPGKNELEQMQCIMEIMGAPPLELIQASPRHKTFFDSSHQPLLTPNSRNVVRHPGASSLQNALQCPDQTFLGFLTLCFIWDPAKRLAPEAALEHPWINANANPRQGSKRSSAKSNYEPSPPAGKRPELGRTMFPQIEKTNG